jgi:hypothetical protein
MIGKLGYGHICLREENLSFNNNYMYTCVRGIDIASFYDFSIVFSNNSDSMVTNNHGYVPFEVITTRSFPHS